jgi:tetratricopeptide (TPR) repeat protein
MLGRLTSMFTLAAAAVVLGPVAEAQAQDGGRFRVLVPYFQPLQGADDDFGKDASEELRELMEGLPTHRPIPEGEIEDEADNFDMKMEDLDCVKSRQLASQINAAVAVCATYTQQPDQSVVVDAEVWDIQSSESFQIEPVTVPRNGHEAAAQQIFQQFDRYNTQVRSAAICADYAASQQWENALRNCDEALAINPGATSVRFQRARILYEMENYPEAMGELEAVLEADPFHEEALQLAGYIATVEGQTDAGRDYYSRYLELNPGDVGIRMRIAYDLAQAGDPVGAMDFIQVGLDVDPENVDLLEQYGGFAFAAALQVQEAAAVGAEDSGALTPEAADYYRKAIAAYEKVYAAKGAETRVAQLRNIISAYVQLGESDRAIQMSERVLETHPQSDQIWMIYAEALQRADRLDDAITALDRVREINPDHPSAALRQGNWYIQAGRIQDAVNILSQAAAGNPQQAEQAGRLIFNEAYTNGYQKDNYAYAIEGMAAAKQLPDLPQPLINQLNFWHGFALYQQAVKEQEPQTLQSAQTTLPKFQEAQRLLQNSGDYPSTVNVNLQQLLGNANTYIEIHDAIIKRGG